MKFKLGESGNPNGRPKGVGHRAQLFNALVAPRKEELVARAVELALSGNEPMLRLLLERLLPSKPQDDPITSIESIEGSLTEKGNKILTLILNGELTPLEGEALLRAIAQQVKLIETDELLKRVEQLEHTQNEKQNRKEN